MDSSADDQMSEQWLRRYTYEEGKAGIAEIPFGSHPLVRLAEARAALRHGSRETEDTLTSSGFWTEEDEGIR
jgi:hypothetical protein